VRFCAILRGMRRKFPRSRRRLPFPALVLPALLAAGCAPFPAHVSHHRGGSPTPSPGKTHAPAPTPSCPATNTQAGSSYVVFGQRYHVLSDPTGYQDRGIASWYGPNFHGKLTSSGATYNMYAMTAADKVLPLCTWVKVTNLDNGKNAIVQINDRGPFVENRIIDLSYAAAEQIDMVGNGTALVDVRAIAPPSKSPPADLAKLSASNPVEKLHHKAALYVQLGAFEDYQNADRLRAKLVLNQVGNVSISRATVHGRRFYRVLVGPVTSVAAIDALTEHLNRLGFGNTDVFIR
jgi:peptidoglycan lytic transglycosylase